MDYEDFLIGLKGNSPELLAKLDELRVSLGLQKLYFIYDSEKEMVFGARHFAGVDRKPLVLKVRDFIKEHTGIDYLADGRDTLLLRSAAEEVEYVILHELKKVSKTEEEFKQLLSEVELLLLDDEDGKLLLTIPFDQQKSINFLLGHLLPWVKEVHFSNDVDMTENAAKQILVLSNGAGGLRIGVAGGGCSGLQYELKVASEPTSEELVFEHKFKDGGEDKVAKIFIKKSSMIVLGGATLDYDPLKGFFLENPNAKSSCGCGQSFGV